MRSALLAVALAAGALAVPHKRAIEAGDVDIVVETAIDIVYYTEIVTVTAGEAATSIAVPTSVAPPATSTAVTSSAAPPAVSIAVTSSAAPPTTSSAITSLVTEQQQHFGHHSWHWSSSSQEAVAPDSVSSAPPPPALTSTSVYIAPSSAPPPPAPTSTSVYVAPSPPSETPTPTPSTTTTAESSPVTPSPTIQPTAPASGISSPPANYTQLVVDHHNVHRRNHSAPDIQWDQSLADTAAVVAESCVYAHNVDQGKDAIGAYGQNIAAGVPDTNITAIITDLFYNGEVNYYNGLYGEDSPDMTNFELWGHFSQIVWHNTTTVGCATQYCPNGLANVGSDVSPYFTVCNYQSPGNYAGEYTNVGYPLDQPTAQWDSLQ